jgi:hypothetical protein
MLPGALDYPDDFLFIEGLMEDVVPAEVEHLAPKALVGETADHHQRRRMFFLSLFSGTPGVPAEYQSSSRCDLC